MYAFLWLSRAYSLGVWQGFEDSPLMKVSVLSESSMHSCGCPGLIVLGCGRDFKEGLPLMKVSVQSESSMHSCGCPGRIVLGCG